MRHDRQSNRRLPIGCVNPRVPGGRAGIRRSGRRRRRRHARPSRRPVPVAAATSTGVPSARLDRSPRITCSEPLTGAQGSLSLAAGGTWKLGDLDPLAVADAGLDLGPHRLAVLVLPAVSLLAAMGEGGQRQRPHAGPLDDHLGVGVHPRQELAVRVGQIDLGPERPALDVQGPRRARDAARDRLVAVPLGEHGRLGPDVDVVGVLLGDVDEDADDVGAVDHVDRRGTAGGQVGSIAPWPWGRPWWARRSRRCWHCGPRSRRRRARGA